MADPPGTGAAAAAQGAVALAAKTRGTQPSPLENMLVARSWINASEDPIVGAGQKGDQFTSKHVQLYNEMARKAIADREPGFETIDLMRDVTFPSTQFSKLRKITYSFLSVRKLLPKTSGDSSKEEYYERIRPRVTSELKKKRLPYGKPEKFESVVDYLKRHPKFMSFMNAEEKVNRPQGKRKQQYKAKLTAVRQQVEKDFGTVPRFAMASGGNDQAVASLSGLMNHTLLRTITFCSTEWPLKLSNSKSRCAVCWPR